MNEKISVTDNSAEAIKTAMAKEGVNQTELAARMKCARQAVQQSLNRKSNNMRVFTMVKMADALGYDLQLVKR